MGVLQSKPCHCHAHPHNPSIARTSVKKRWIKFTELVESSHDYCSITVVNHELSSLIRFVSRFTTHPYKKFYKYTLFSISYIYPNIRYDIFGCKNLESRYDVFGCKNLESKHTLNIKYFYSI